MVLKYVKDVATDTKTQVEMRKKSDAESNKKDRSFSFSLVCFSSMWLPTPLWLDYPVLSGGKSTQIFYLSKSINTTVTSKSPAFKIVLK